MRAALLLAVLAASTVALAGCGGDTGSTAADTATTETTTTAPTTGTTGTTVGPTTQTRVITIRVVGGVPQGGIQRPTIDEGEKVVLVVRTDTGKGVHLHGYNIERDVVPGTPTRIPFTATIPGRFELELHPTDTLLAEIEVRP